MEKEKDTCRGNQIKVEVKALVKTLPDTLTEVKTKTVCDTVRDVKAEVLMDTTADTLPEVRVKIIPNCRAM